jgi:hypothetical protein
MSNSANPRRKFLRLLLGAGSLVASPFLLRAYARYIEPQIIITESVQIATPRIPAGLDGLKIGFISDFHVGNGIDQARVEQIVEQLNALQPDVTLLGGDYVHKLGYADTIAHGLRNLYAPLGVYAVLGNHDYWNAPRQVLTALQQQFVNARMPFQLLRNDSVRLQVGATPLNIVGVDDISQGYGNINKALRNVPRHEPALLLVHEPDFADVASETFPFALQISGHTHGGQVRIPFMPARFLPRWGRKYLAGSFTVNDMPLYVSRGVGMSWLPMRFLCPPEVTLLTLRAG